jgi:hypothetical protein
MARTNVIQFAPALQRRGARQGNRAGSATDYGSWDDHYPTGIDGLWAAPEMMGMVVPFLRP